MRRRDGFQGLLGSPSKTRRRFCDERQYDSREQIGSGDGAIRGIGQALVDEALRRGAQRVYAGTRQPLAHPDDRVRPVTPDVTNAAQIQEAVEEVGSLDILVNNAGIAVT
jgi:hypothetical protein